MEYSVIELRVIAGASGAAIPLTPAELDSLLANPAYHASLGEPARARHFRRSLRNGSCFHLVIENESASLHLDQHDPHAGPAHLLAHLLQESPVQAFSLFTAAAALLRRVAAR